METKNSKKPTVIVLAVLLLAAVAYALFSNAQHKELQAALESEKTSIQTELTSMIAQYDVKIEENTSLKEALVAARADIIAYRDSLVKEKKTSYKLLKRYQNKLYKLQEQNKELFGQLENLTAENTQLSSDIAAANATIASQASSNELLASQNEDLSAKVAVGAILSAADVSVVPLKRTASGALKKTNRYKKTVAFQLSMNLPRNPLTTSGDKQVYLILEDAQGKVLNSKGTFEVEGRSLSYSDKASFHYQNQEMELVLVTEFEKGLLQKGTYVISAYLDGSILGAASVALKPSFLGVF